MIIKAYDGNICVSLNNSTIDIVNKSVLWGKIIKGYDSENLLLFIHN